MNKDNDKPFGYAQELPEDIRKVFQDLCQDIASLHSKWKFYLDLFSDHDTIQPTQRRGAKLPLDGGGVTTKRYYYVRCVA